MFSFFELHAREDLTGELKSPMAVLFQPPGYLLTLSFLVLQLLAVGER
jgi:hypothetical protein